MNGSNDNKKRLTALGYGFSGVDIIKTDSGEFYFPGGTSANVMTALASFGWKSVILKAKYADLWNDFVDSVWEDMGVSVKNCVQSTRNVHRVVQMFKNDEHYFLTKCPECGLELLKISLPPEKPLKKALSDSNFNILFFDRVPTGLKNLFGHLTNMWTFYEPNGGVRSYSAFLSNVALCNIVKFSDARVSKHISDRLINDLANQKAKTKLIIITHQSKGISYALLGKSSKLVTLHVNLFENAVDLSGAGDWLSAGFINNFIKHYPQVTDSIDATVIEDSLKLGHLQAEMCCNHIGAMGCLMENINVQISVANHGCSFCKV